VESIKILIFSDWFTPAFKAGGPIRSVVNFVERFKDEHEIYVLTTDRDLGDANPFEHIEPNKWIRQDGFEAMYLSPDKLQYRLVKNIIKGLNPDKIYLNSMFSRFTIFSLISSLYTNKIILAPRGMLRSSALSVKPIRKYLYLSILRFFNIDQHIAFHSTSIEETKSIKQIFPTAPTIIEASNLPVAVSKALLPHNKIKGELKMIFVGRSHPIKNLLFLLSCLENIKGNCTLKIITTKEDEDYWQECMSVIKKLTHIQTNVLFDLPHHEVKEHLEWADLFVLPTQGENFGHAIFEALAVGCPVLISDQTPWRNLEKSKAGIDLPINLDQFKHAIDRFLLMDKDVYQPFRKGSLAYAKLYYEQMNVGPLYKKLFENPKISKFGH
jgi:glycosyltransferase involved in cell wall biosynthesis